MLILENPETLRFMSSANFLKFHTFTKIVVLANKLQLGLNCSLLTVTMISGTTITFKHFYRVQTPVSFLKSTKRPHTNMTSSSLYIGHTTSCSDNSGIRCKLWDVDSYSADLLLVFPSWTKAPSSSISFSLFFLHDRSLLFAPSPSPTPDPHLPFAFGQASAL